MKRKLHKESRIILIFVAISIIISVFYLIFSSSNTPVKTGADRLTATGDSLVKAALFDEAIIVYNKASKIYKLNGNLEGYINCIANTGYCYRKKGQLKLSIEIFKEADSLSNPILDLSNPIRLKIFNQMGAAYHYLGEYEIARKYLEKTLKNVDTTQIYDDVKVADQLVIGYNIIAMFDAVEGQFENALNNFEKAVKIRKVVEGEVTPFLPDLYTNEANIYSIKGDYDNSSAYYEKALNAQIEIYGDDHPFVALTYMNMGVLFGEHLGDYDRAILLYEKALSIYLKKYGQKNMEVARVYFNIGSNYYRSGNFSKSLSFYDKALSVYYDVLAKESHSDVSMSYHEMGKVYESLKNYKKAISYYEKALSIRLNVFGEQHSDVAVNYNSLGITNRILGNYNKAIKYHKDAIRILKKSYGNIHPEISESYNDLGAVYLAEGRFKEAIQNIQQAITANIPDYNNTDPVLETPIQKALSDQVLLSSLSLKAEIFQKKFFAGSNNKNDLIIALDNYKLLTRLIDKIRRGYKAEGSKFLFAQNNAKIFEKAIKTSVKLYKLTGQGKYKQDAFFFSEQNKSEILNDALVETNAKKFSGIPEELLNKEKQLKIDLSFYDTELQMELYETRKPDSIRVAQLKGTLFNLQNEYLGVIETFEKNYSKYHDLKYKRNIISAEELQRTIDGNTTLIEYFVGEKTLYTFTVSKNGLEVFESRIDSSFTSLNEIFFRSIKKLNKTKYLISAKQLYNILIKPIELEIAANQNIIIIPDAILHYIPFEALVKENKNIDEKDFASLDYFIKHHEISYNYSAALYLNGILKSKVKSSSYGYLGFAPVFDNEDKGGFSFSGLWKSLTKSSENSNNSRQFEDKHYNPLPYTETEVNSIVALFKKHGLGAKSFIREDANESIFKSQIRNSKFIHIATHSIINPVKPSLSSVILYGNNESNVQEDGILYSSEIYNLNLNSDLVVLSSCESGIGKLIKGEGMMALTRGFLFAGSKNVITSLWKVLDKSTSDLMITFYENTLSGKSYKESLRNAKLKMINNKKIAFPVNWSGFVLIGE
ncbi:MAG: CHAT domain-containing protein [Bacteroidetes bacterium]|nr:CHAT domain-containing protein [Bacteroidota bacterium]